MCLGGSLSRIESACSQLKVSQSASGVRGSEHPAQASVAQHGTGLGVTAREPDAHPAVPGERCGRAQGGQVRVGVGDDGGVAEIEEVGGVDGGLGGHRDQPAAVAGFCQALRRGQT